MLRPKKKPHLLIKLLRGYRYNFTLLENVALYEIPVHVLFTFHTGLLMEIAIFGQCCNKIGLIFFGSLEKHHKHSMH